VRAVFGTVAASVATGVRIEPAGRALEQQIEEQVMERDKKELASTETHTPARPLQFIKDRDGNGWICDKGIDPDGDLEAQGCWRCEEMAFPMGGH